MPRKVAVLSSGTAESSALISSATGATPLAAIRSRTVLRYWTVDSLKTGVGPGSASILQVAGAAEEPPAAGGPLPPRAGGLPLAPGSEPVPVPVGSFSGGRTCPAQPVSVPRARATIARHRGRACPAVSHICFIPLLLRPHAPSVLAGPGTGKSRPESRAAQNSDLREFFPDLCSPARRAQRGSKPRGGPPLIR